MRVAINTFWLTLLIGLVAACGVRTPEELHTQKEVVQAFERQGHPLLDRRDMPWEFNHVKAYSYKLDQEWIYIFAYPSVEDRQQGVRDYEHVRAKGQSWIPGRVYEVDNVFILHLKEVKDLDMEIQAVVQALQDSTEKARQSTNG